MNIIHFKNPNRPPMRCIVIDNSEKMCELLNLEKPQAVGHIEKLEQWDGTINIKFYCAMHGIPSRLLYDTYASSSFDKIEGIIHPPVVPTVKRHVIRRKKRLLKHQAQTYAELD